MVGADAEDRSLGSSGSVARCRGYSDTVWRTVLSVGRSGFDAQTHKQRLVVSLLCHLEDGGRKRRGEMLYTQSTP